MDMDRPGHFVRQRRVFVAVSVLLAALYFFCLDLSTLSIFGIEAEIKDQSWINGILISLWAYYLYRFRVARFKLGDDWRVKVAMKAEAGTFVNKHVAKSLAHKENIEKVQRTISLPPAVENWNIELTLTSYSSEPENARFSATKIYRQARVKWHANTLGDSRSGDTKIEIAFGTKETWKAYALTAKMFLFKDIRLGEYYLPTLIGFAWLVIHFLKVKYTAGGISVGCSCW